MRLDQSYSMPYVKCYRFAEAQPQRPDSQPATAAATAASDTARQVPLQRHRQLPRKVC